MPFYLEVIPIKEYIVIVSYDGVFIEEDTGDNEPWGIQRYYIEADSEEEIRSYIRRLHNVMVSRGFGGFRNY